MRNLRTLGLSLVAVFAMSAMLASAAQAEAGAKPGVFTIGGGGSAAVEGEQTVENVFTREGRKVTCEEAKLTGTIENGAEEAEATPTYGKCHATILGTKFPATVTMNGCTYRFKLTVDVISEQDTFTALSSLICPKNKTVEIHVYSNHTNHTNNTSLCTITIFGSSDNANQNLKHIDLTNEPAGGITPNDYLLGHITISNITDTEHNPGIICGPHHSSTSSLTGTGTIKASVAGKPVDLTVSTKP